MSQARDSTDYMSNIDVAANAIHIISEESING